jgi:DNA-binding NtrC family response regulator
MQPHSDTPIARAAGSILLIGNGCVDPLMESARALESLADTCVVSSADALRTIGECQPEVIIADTGDATGQQILAEAAMLHPLAIRILLSDDEPVGDLANGTATSLPRNLEWQTLRAVCAMALQCAAAQRAARDAGASARHDAEPSNLGLEDLGELDRYEGILTRSSTMKYVLGMLRKIEDSDTTVLIHGETGTGKELVAEAIHARSRRRNGRFVAVNLGALSDTLRESELFGHVRGAFTGATESRGGLFVEANGGCIFLDEVADATPGLQVALLRVLEEGTITPVGSDRPRSVDVRIISGTHRDLEALVRQGTFRRDLYYRLNVFPIELPPLRERQEDIFPLARHFLAIASLAMGKKPPGISRDAREALEAYHWEGNVRELRNVMERAAILCKGGLVIAADLPVADRGTVNPAASTAATIAIPNGGATLEDLEREIFQKTLALTGGNQRRAASMLGLCESTFRFRLRKLSIPRRRLRALAASAMALTAFAADPLVQLLSISGTL